jgi:hypothetical protein
MMRAPGAAAARMRWAASGVAPKTAVAAASASMQRSAATVTERVGQTRWLAYVPGNDFLIHVRDPLTGRGSKKAFRVGCTRKAGSRHRIPRF